MGAATSVLMGSCGEAVETGEEAHENMETETLTVEPVTETEVNTDQCPTTLCESNQDVEKSLPNPKFVGEVVTDITTQEEEQSDLFHSDDQQDLDQSSPDQPLSTEQLSALVDELTTRDDTSEISNNGAFSDVQDQTKPETFENGEENIPYSVGNNANTLDDVAESNNVEGISTEDLKLPVPDEPLLEGACSSSSGSMNASTESDDISEAVNSKKQYTSELLKTVVETQKTKSPEKKSTSGNFTVKVSKTEEKRQIKNDEPVPKCLSGKSKKKEDKSIEHILRALSSLQTTEEKLAALCKKYADLHEEHRVVQSSFKQVQRKLTVNTREKDQLQTEHTKAVMAKSKLESLCRELQKHNQMIRQESLQRAREEDEKRKEISAKFQSTISEIQQQMKENHERNVKLREENAELAGKLKTFIEQYEHREKQVEKVMQHRELEQKLADAKLAQANALSKQMDEKHRQEKEILLLQAAEHQKKSKLLDAQLDMYKEKYEEFQSTINRSNEMFQKFKTEMDKMTKRIKKLEKEGAQWKSKWEGANRALLEMVEEKSKYDRERPQLLAKISKLESLCRAMQAERKGKKVLEAVGIDEVSMTSTEEPTKCLNNSPPSMSPGNNTNSVIESSADPHSDSNCSTVSGVASAQNADPSVFSSENPYDVSSSVDHGQIESSQTNYLEFQSSQSEDTKISSTHQDFSEIKAYQPSTAELTQSQFDNVDSTT